MRLSIAIPTYNFAAFLPATLDSILPQVGTDMEVLVVDGASTDETPEVMLDYQARWGQKVRYVRLPQKGGIDADIAKSVELSRGEYCWLFSADDIMKPRALERLVPWLAEGHDVILCEHTNCDLKMRHAAPYPIFFDPRPRVCEFGVPSARRDWVADAKNTEALFSFMSGLILRRQLFVETPVPTQFMGSCWGHAARLMAAAKRPSGLRVCAVGETWLDKRGENDSFLTNGLARRIALSVDGFTEMTEHYFGDDPALLAEVRRILRREHSFFGFVGLRKKGRLAPAQEDPALIDSMFRQIYGRGDTTKAQVQYALFSHLPAAVVETGARSYGIGRAVYRTLYRRTSRALVGDDK